MLRGKRERQEWVANNCPRMETYRAWSLLYSWRPKSITEAMINVNCFVFIFLGEHLGLSLKLAIGLHQTLFCVKPDNRWFLLRLAFTASLPLVIPLGPACTRKQLLVFLNLSWLLSLGMLLTAWASAAPQLLMQSLCSLNNIWCCICSHLSAANARGVNLSAANSS